MNGWKQHLIVALICIILTTSMWCISEYSQMIYSLRDDVLRWLGTSQEEYASDWDMEPKDSSVVKVRHIHKSNIWTSGGVPEWGDTYEVSFRESWAHFIICFMYQPYLHISLLLRLLQVGVQEYNICQGCGWTIYLMKIPPEKSAHRWQRRLDVSVLYELVFWDWSWKKQICHFVFLYWVPSAFWWGDHLFLSFFSSTLWSRCSC